MNKRAYANDVHTNFECLKFSFSYLLLFILSVLLYVGNILKIIAEEKYKTKFYARHNYMKKLENISKQVN